MGWKEIARSATGTSHQSQGIPCQDYGCCRIFNDVIVGAVADGAGSAKYADVGSKLAVETVIKCFSDINEYPENQEELEPNFSQPMCQAEAAKLFTKIVNGVIQELNKQASKEDYSINDLACTLLVFVATPHWLAAMQIGDGFIVVRPEKSEEYQLLFHPDKGEFANETTFITSNNSLQEMQVKVIPGEQAFICASTDGLEKVAIRLNDWTPFPPFFKPFEEYLQETSNPKKNYEYVDVFLNSERLNSRTDDDKTLLLSLWEKE
ncbi:PP2C family serine/threonine-protein phosphatase [Anabaena sp. CCY 9402-a]|uniref:PP2C family serine/threonine-protein phosphatase n=1 Tax=Anabaena sp. CCY 9402-a TaxID=3103867 RepID=UPI0039C6C455